VSAAVRLEATVWWTDERRFRVTKLDDGTFEIAEVSDVLIVDVAIVSTMREVRARITAAREGIQ